ncbi:MAG TPA: SGNH/GDSL hydrolase family protein, partial [Alphaproteobacteria bacterium]|nr:SGNH/GDSL hydrolase family protein [Alphaproteobacteria bacterium]
AALKSSRGFFIDEKVYAHFEQQLKNLCTGPLGQKLVLMTTALSVDGKSGAAREETVQKCVSDPDMLLFSEPIARLNAIARRLAAAHGLPLIDLGGYAAAHPYGRLLYYDHCHFSPLGNAVVGRWLAEQTAALLEARGLRPDIARAA